MRMLARVRAWWTLVAITAMLAPAVARAQQERVLQIPIRTDGPKNLDPVRGSTQYDDMACSQIYETLLQWKYLVRPLQLETLLLAEMPKDTLNPDGTQTWTFKLKPNVFFQDDECFPGGKGRQMTAADVFYSWRRFADPANEYLNFRFFDGVIKGFTEYRDQQAELVKAGKPFDYAAPVEGLKQLSDLEFQVILTKPVYPFIFKLAQFQTAVVPREAVEKYKSQFSLRPVGTGPFMLKPGEWLPGQRMTLRRNPTYRQETYPAELPADPKLAARDKELGFVNDAGKPLPLVDRIEISFYVPDPAMWLDFQGGKLAFTQVPSEYQPEAFNLRTKKLKDEYRAKGIVDHTVPLTEFIFRGFNMEDPVVGGYTPEKRALRQALSLAFDVPEMNEKFYNGLNNIFDGPIPTGLDGAPPNGEAPNAYRGPDIDEAKRLLADAGYPGGRDKDGKQLVIDYYTSRGGNAEEQMQAEQRFAEAIGVKLNARFLDFSELDEAVRKKKAPMFSYAWGYDYPDAENGLMLFYSKTKSPGVGAFNYDRKEYDALYQQLVVMKPGPERTTILEQARDMLIEDAPIYGSMSRNRSYLVQPWLKNFKPTEDFNNWMKYLAVDESKR